MFQGVRGQVLGSRWAAVGPLNAAINKVLSISNVRRRGKLQVAYKA
jgi:hypothetical protein